MIIDDEIYNIECLQAMIEQFGYQCDSANSGAKGLQVIEKRLGLVRSGQAAMYQLIFLDYSMPEMDGP